ncbi:hypothetical protein C7H19_11510 [Aphanothece hegewaldii CCALA 016]|uniref:Uncharacterized protein n=1 Tax=Aphanothece hegewaldii CCALA 016 TaxID=2107694 RepID=A0A2T1LXE9_9CHRO|nr:hypothetical protein [Aphanothece hegewaldii]PSF37062.1 hypothetical protein C7H19_11510 [Aphanothece hegewaldii CCALA 016]
MKKLNTVVLSSILLFSLRVDLEKNKAVALDSLREKINRCTNLANSEQSISLNATNYCRRFFEIAQCQLQQQQKTNQASTKKSNAKRQKDYCKTPLYNISLIDDIGVWFLNQKNVGVWSPNPLWSNI